MDVLDILSYSVLNILQSALISYLLGTSLTFSVYICCFFGFALLWCFLIYFGVLYHKNFENIMYYTKNKRNLKKNYDIHMKFNPITAEVRVGYNLMSDIYGMQFKYNINFGYLDKKTGLWFIPIYTKINNQIYNAIKNETIIKKLERKYGEAMPTNISQIYLGEKL